MRCSIVPPYLLARIAAGAEEREMPIVARAARRALLGSVPVRSARNGSAAGFRARDFGVEPNRLPAATHSQKRTIADAESTETLPGIVVRREGESDVGDPAADEAYDGLGATFALFDQVYDWNSIDDRGLPLQATVHYGEEYDNAFWDGTRMVFGDGDGEIFRRFTVSLDVIGHELTHGITQYTSDLVYRGQSGALNESLSDVFGSLVEQHQRGQTVDQASWLIGAGLFTDAVEGVALRSMKAPGTAFDDDLLGKDPQPAHMDEYVHTSDDDGGVHINSGIPNRAFQLAASAIGGTAWTGAGEVWWTAMRSPTLLPDADFAAFAAETVAAATARFGPTALQRAAVLDAWRTVGVEPAHAERSDGDADSLHPGDSGLER